MKNIHRLLQNTEIGGLAKCTENNFSIRPETETIFHRGGTLLKQTPKDRTFIHAAGALQ